jgi:hypothetical protein
VSGAPPIAFDWRPLVAPVDPRAAAAFARALAEQGRVPRGTDAARIVAVVILMVCGGGIILTFGFIAVAIVATATAAGSGWPALLVFVPLAAIAAVIVLIAVLALRGGRSSKERWLRLDTFARANGMTYVPSLPQPHLPGMIFALGSDRQATDLVRGELPRFVEFGNHRYVTGSGDNRSTVSWGYVAVRLDVPLPHIVLDAVGNNGVGTNLPSAFDRRQRLSLEGDFDRYFHLYCPRGYEADALYLFTPDVMARFIDNAAQLDVEIVDDWLFLYSRRDLSTLDPATWAWLFATVAALLDKLAQWARWRDDRLTQAATVARSIPAGWGDAAASGIPGASGSAQPLVTPPPLALRAPGVAPPGQRLRPGTRWGVVVVCVIVFGWLLLFPFGGLAALVAVFAR